MPIVEKSADMQDIALIVSLILNAIMLAVTIIMCMVTMRADRRAKILVAESRRPYLVADVMRRRDREHNQLLFLAVYNLNDFPAKKVRFRYDKKEIERALACNDHDDSFRVAALRSLFWDLPLVEKGTPFILPFGLEFPSYEKDPQGSISRESATWKDEAVIRIKLEYQDMMGNTYMSDLQELNTGTVWMDEPELDHTL
jgi:hypothetical protein